MSELSFKKISTRRKRCTINISIYKCNVEIIRIKLLNLAYFSLFLTADLNYWAHNIALYIKIFAENWSANKTLYT